MLAAALLAFLVGSSTALASPRHRTSSTRSQQCCARLAQEFDGETDRVVVREHSRDRSHGQHARSKSQQMVLGDVDSLYDQLNARWSALSVMQPACIVRPASAEEVSRTVKVLIDEDCAFAIKSGGHMSFAGANNIDDGISLDLGLLQTKQLSADKTVVTLGTGLTSDDVYAFLEGTRLGFPAGACGTTGLGGLSVGGGQSYFQARVGWLVDNVVAYEVVLASGAVVLANQTHHTDLYRALKGGGTNFGVVTRIDVATFPQGDIWGGQVVVPATEELVDEFLSAIVAYTAANNDYVNAGVQAGTLFLADGRKAIDMAVVATDGVVNPPILRNLTSMQPQVINTLQTRTPRNLDAETDIVMPHGLRQTFATVTVPNDLEALRTFHRVFEQSFIAASAEVPDLDWFNLYIPQPKVIETHSALRGGNMLGLEGKGEDQISMLNVPRWKDPAHDGLVYKHLSAFIDEVTAALKAIDKYSDFLYLNFAMKDQKPFCTYGEANLRFLREAARRYDPDDVFQRLVPGGFKLKDAC